MIQTVAVLRCALKTNGKYDKKYHRRSRLCVCVCVCDVDENGDYFFLYLN